MASDALDSARKDVEFLKTLTPLFPQRELVALVGYAHAAEHEYTGPLARALKDHVPVADLEHSRRADDPLVVKDVDLLDSHGNKVTGNLTVSFNNAGFPETGVFVDANGNTDTVRFDGKEVHGPEEEEKHMVADTNTTPAVTAAFLFDQDGKPYHETIEQLGNDVKTFEFDKGALDYISLQYNANTRQWTSNSQIIERFSTTAQKPANGITEATIFYGPDGVSEIEFRRADGTGGRGIFNQGELQVDLLPNAK
jgi:hypothetical protein